MMKVLLALGVFCCFFSGVAWAQELEQTPSQKTKEAIEKFKKAPSAAGKGLGALMEAGKAKVRGMLESKGPAKAETAAAAPPEKKPDTPRYSPAGKRDPFEPLALRPPERAAPERRREPQSPLERFNLGQLKLVGIIWNVKEPRAMVEDTTGLGYVVKVGTLIGSNEGKIKAIKPNEVVVEETVVDILGVSKKREVRMKLPTDR